MVTQNNELDESKLFADVTKGGKYLSFFGYFYLLLPKSGCYFYTDNPSSMQKKHFLYVILLCGIMAANINCSKDDDDNPAPKTKTELLTTGSWKFSEAKVGGTSVAAFIQPCQKDNILTFLAAGTGIAAEGALKCNASDPDNYSFDWSFQTNETVLFVSTTFFAGGSSTFTIVSLTETELVLSQMISLGSAPQTAEITFVHY